MLSRGDRRGTPVLLYKGGGKPPADPSSFRPITLIDSVAKLFERVILRRLEGELGETGGLTIKQYGFRKGVGAVDAVNRVLEIAGENQGRDKMACEVVSLDVQNAFNTASWTSIDEALRKRGISRRMVTMMRAYMSDSEVQVPGGNGVSTFMASEGVPQGSVLRPALWNILYDSLLRLDLPPGINAVAYADDLALVALARTTTELETAVGDTVRTLSD